MDGKVRIILNLLRLSAQLHRLGLQLVEGTGLSSVQQWQLLGIIDRNEGITLRELSEETLVTKQNMTGLIERMRKGGWITTWNDVQDRRVTRVRITQQGKDTLKRMQPRTAASNARTFQDFQEEELAMLDEMLDRLSRTVRVQVMEQIERSKKQK
ncbi:MarR family winged helix-turn-helix transcriptional regulator [Brevibacillus sp. GCM10020057]|uniref:MarR family winged helix-turn-helix transcriptional regulator n=1 Tax=Brevibacillus sp. GCM10020057 TaxID=3317327 RepID=UPI00363C2936